MSFVVTFSMRSKQTNLRFSWFSLICEINIRNLLLYELFANVVIYVDVKTKQVYVFANRITKIISVNLKKKTFCCSFSHLTLSHWIKHKSNRFSAVRTCNFTKMTLKKTLNIFAMFEKKRFPPNFNEITNKKMNNDENNNNTNTFLHFL